MKLAEIDDKQSAFYSSVFIIKYFKDEIFLNEIC